MNTKSSVVNLFVIFNAILFGASFLTPCFLGALCHVGLLYYISKKTHIRFFEGFVWGCIVFGLQSAGLFYVVYYDGFGPMRLAYPLLFVIYCGLHSALWIGLSQIVTNEYRPFWWAFCAVVYTYYMHLYILWPLGRVEGYPFAFPLIPLVSIASVMYSSLWSHPFELFTLLVVGQISFIEGFEKKSYWILTFITVLPLFAGVFVSFEKVVKPEWFNYLCYIKPPKNRTNSFETAQQLCYEMIASKKDEFQFFVTPESVFPFPLNEGLSTKMWSEYALENKVFLLSAHLSKKQKIYNSVFLINQCRIILNYNKSHLIPTFERSIQEKENNIRTFFNFFLSKRSDFSRSKKKSPLISYKLIGPFIPVICSELFWLNRFHPSTIPAIAVVNDGCFGPTRFDYLLLQTGRLKALCESRWIVYVGWNYAYVISPLGKIESFR